MENPQSLAPMSATIEKLEAQLWRDLELSGLSASDFLIACRVAFRKVAGKIENENQGNRSGR